MIATQIIITRNNKLIIIIKSTLQKVRYNFTKLHLIMSPSDERRGRRRRRRKRREEKEVKEEEGRSRAIKYILYF